MFSATPTTNQDRLKQLGQSAQGFLYYVSQRGTTGVRSQMADDFTSQIARIRQEIQLPIVAGFGIANREMAKKALESADGFVVGSAIVKKMEEKVDPSVLQNLSKRSIREVFHEPNV